MKITSFLIGLALLGFFMTVFGLFMTEMNSNYGVSYDNDSIAVYEQLDEMEALASDIEAGSDIEEKTGVLDVIGGYISDAYNVLKLTKQSFNIFDEMNNEAIEQANLGIAGKALRIAVSIIVLVLIVLGVIISAILKWPL